MSGLTVTGLTVTGLTKSFGKNLVIDNVSFEVEEGEFAILLGPSGCGKSTILRLVAGLDRQDAGDVAIGGTVVNDLPPRARDVAMVFQSYALYPHLSVFEKLRPLPPPECLREPGLSPQDRKTREGGDRGEGQ
jgi:ABC-type sugar transport system ATPase subunit